jgi:hypothetical protein
LSVHWTVSHIFFMCEHVFTYPITHICFKQMQTFHSLVKNALQDISKESLLLLEIEKRWLVLLLCSFCSHCKTILYLLNTQNTECSWHTLFTQSRTNLFLLLHHQLKQDYALNLNILVSAV